jgi:hypothetical protein
MAPFLLSHCPADRRLVLRPAGVLSNSPQWRRAQGEPDAIDGEATGG